jgi:N,N-dimethylformamidase beta subunit-like, C-terminal/Domain of unknown function (DUF4082)/Fibronectin type III domain
MPFSLRRFPSLVTLGAPTRASIQGQPPISDRHAGARRARVLVLVVGAALAAGAASPAASQAAVCTPPVVNQIACENSLPGADPSTWEIDGAGDQTIQGFGTSMSVNVGSTISFKIKSATSNYRIDIFRLGYYGGDGARLIQSNVAHTGTGTQPSCLTQASTGLVDCGNWSVSASWAVPRTAVSGVYTAHLHRNDTGGESQIVFVVRNDASHSDVVLQTSDATWEAYNTYGGQSLYSCTNVCPPGSPSTYLGAYKVSYNRPFHTAEDDTGRSWLFTGAEYSMIRFLEANGYDMSYVSSSDVNSRGALLQNHKLFISSGHDEYWSAGQRNSVEAARDAGVNLAFFTGNEMFWKTRWEPSIDGSNAADRTLVTYKDTHFPQQQDPVSWTGTWRDPRFASAADDVTPENAVTGQSFIVNSGTSRITVPYAYRQMRMWRNTAATSLSPGQSLQLAPNTLGYEWDVDADNGYRPDGEFHLSSTTVSGLELFTDYGSNTAFGGTATHNLSMYRAPSGARVFGSGTVQWAFGLDDWHPDATADLNMQQATVNLFGDMSAQPATLQSGLVAAPASTDNTAPTSTITSPPTTVADGAQVTLNGTATDLGGGVVAGVEVSTDGGSTWHQATGTTSWSYTWVAHGSPAATVKWRAVDDSGNLQTPGAGVSVTVTCPCSLWGPNVTPIAADSSDATAVEVGTKFTTDTYGSISGIRFYKASTNTGTHVGSLWTAGGQRLAQVTFSGESASGWQTATFSSPVAVQPDTTYIVSYYAPNGHYTATADYFYRAPAPGPNGGAITDSGPLHAVKKSATTDNGVFSYGAASTFPTMSFGAPNYWVDVLFAPLPPPGPVTGVTAAVAGSTSATVSWTAPSSGGQPTSYKVTPFIGSTAQTPKTVTGTPPATSTKVTGLTTGSTYTFTVQAVNPNGSGPVSAQSNAVTPLTAVAPSAPTGVSALPASNSARVTWTAPDSDGDSAITGYTVTPYIGATAQTPVQAGASATSATVSGLTNGTSYTFKVTATNGVGTGPASAASAAVTPQATIFDFATPSVVDSLDTTAVELGVKFTADYNGSITGVRFYKAATNTGTHIGSLWSASGTRLAQATFTGESDSGWQTVTFSSPVAISANTTYVASYFDPSGHYSFTSPGLASAVDNPPLHAVANGTSANGVYAYSTSSTFPTNSYNATNYWVDVLYAVPAPGQVTGVTAAEAGSTSANVSWSAPSGGGPVTSYKVTPFIGSTAQTPKIITGTPPTTSTKVTGLTTGSTYTFTVQALNANGPGPASAQSNAVTPTAPVVPSAPTAASAQPASNSARVTWTTPDSDGDSAITGYTVTPYIGAAAQTPVQAGASATSATVSGLTNGTSYTFKVTASNAIGTSPASGASNAVTPQATIYGFPTPTMIDSGDTAPVELGVKFTADYSGSVTGVRFYKAAANTGTHIGSLWSASGTRLAQATFTGESASGWQSVTFSSPVAITANTTYVASYFDPNGHYSLTPGGLSSGVDNPPLHAVANSTSANGVYAYGASSSFPTGSFSAGDYGVDVLVAPPSAPGQVTGVSATAGQSSATVSWSAPAGGGPVTSYKVTPFIGSTAQTAKTITGSPPATSTTVSGLTPGTAYTFTVQASNAGGSGSPSSQSNSVTPLGATAPGAPTGASAQADSTSALVSWTAPSSDGGSAITGYTVTPYIGATAQTPVQAGASATSTRVVGLTNSTSYTFRVAATNSVGTGSASGASNAVTPQPSIFELATPGTADAGDPGSVALGVKFTSDVAGSVTGVRFYKAAANTGTHVGALWSAAGTLLGQGTFTGESASGWQTVTFAAPVAISANTTYVASYLAPNGHYSLTGAGFASGPVDNPPLHAVANGTSPNGVYIYSAISAFPTGSFNASNYWVDVLFAPGS